MGKEERNRFFAALIALSIVATAATYMANRKNIEESKELAEDKPNKPSVEDTYVSEKKYFYTAPEGAILEGDKAAIYCSPTVKTVSKYQVPEGYVLIGKIGVKTSDTKAKLVVDEALTKNISENHVLIMHENGETEEVEYVLAEVVTRNVVTAPEGYTLTKDKEGKSVCVKYVNAILHVIDGTNIYYYTLPDDYSFIVDPNTNEVYGAKYVQPIRNEDGSYSAPSGYVLITNEDGQWVAVNYIKPMAIPDESLSFCIRK